MPPPLPPVARAYLRIIRSVRDRAERTIEARLWRRPMSEDHAYIHQEWHRAASTRDIPALIALYADDAILESPLVPVILDKSDGILHGKAEIGRFLEAGARSRPIDLVRWHRSDTYFSAGATLIWEYPRATPDGDQVEIVEVMDI